MPQAMFLLVFGALLLMALGLMAMLIKSYVKVDQGKALIRNGMGGAKVSFSGSFVFPMIHKAELLDLSVKRVEIHRVGREGLVCKDNMRADIKVAFFVRVNKTAEDSLKVAQSLGCERASKQQALVDLFDAKFSEALKTVGKQFDFVELYEARDRFKSEILQIIGTDLNGFVLDDCAIDYLEQTSLEYLNPDNILDSEGIKKIAALTAQQKILANQIEREREKTMTKQDVEAKETILELNRQLAESEARQKREVESIQAREQAEAEKIVQEERLKSERARIQTEEELMVAEEVKMRQVIVAQKSKARTDAVESERVEKDRLLEVNERERIVALAQFEKNRAIEQERKNIQDLIRERVMVEKAVVEEQERIKDVQAQAAADREKSVQLTRAEMEAQEALVRQVRSAEAARQASEMQAAQKLIEADAEFNAAAKRAEAMKTLAEARAAEEATLGLSEARVMEAKASAIEKEGTAEAVIISRKAEAEAQRLTALAEAEQKRGFAEAEVMAKKFTAEANGLREKAESMKLLDGVGKEHEEFKLKLNKEKEVELAHIHIQEQIAEAQAQVISEALRHSKIEIVGGENTFFDKITSGISHGRFWDRVFANSENLTQVKKAVLDGKPGQVGARIRGLIGQLGLNPEEIKDLSMAHLFLKLSKAELDETTQTQVSRLRKLADAKGWTDLPISSLL
ncbi:MAG: flotillin family protein [Acidobacteria bacterium]|nr:flotillin family protein [Acidobacteriota bacterium]MCB9396777.1 flotillin family protein [Acidobacteriota bacterium]